MPFDEETMWERARKKAWDKVCAECVRVILDTPWGRSEVDAFCIADKGHEPPGHLIATEVLTWFPEDIIKRMLPEHERRPF